MTASTLATLWQEVLSRTRPGAVPEARELWPAVVLLAFVVAVPTARRWGRALVTVAHETGHAAMGIACGRRFHGFVVERNLGGHAVTSGREGGPGRVATTWAGYPAPALLAAVVLAGALRGWAGLVLGVGLVLAAGLLVMARSVRTVMVVLAVGGLIGAVWWWGGAYRSGLVAGLGLVLLVGAWESLGDVARSRDGAQDHCTLARLTPLPAGVWLVTWFLADAAATAGAVWLASGVR